jgi:hypothetical protein
MTRRQVFILINDSELSVPEVAGHVVKNWENISWLEELLKKYSESLQTEYGYVKIACYLRGGNYIETVRYVILKLIGLDKSKIGSIMNKSINKSTYKPAHIGIVSDHILSLIKEADKKRKAKSEK